MQPLCISLDIGYELPGEDKPAPSESSLSDELIAALIFAGAIMAVVVIAIILYVIRWWYHHRETIRHERRASDASDDTTKRYHLEAAIKHVQCNAPRITFDGASDDEFITNMDTDPDMMYEYINRRDGQYQKLTEDRMEVKGFERIAGDNEPIVEADDVGEMTYDRDANIQSEDILQPTEGDR